MSVGSLEPITKSEEETNMNPFAALAVKAIGGGTAAALLSLGVAGGLAQAASPNPSPTRIAARFASPFSRPRRTFFT